MTIGTMIRRAALVGVAAAALAATPAFAQKTKLTVYTALENDQLAPFKTAIETAVPEVDVVWVRDSTGVITARAAHKPTSVTIVAQIITATRSVLIPARSQPHASIAALRIITSISSDRLATGHRRK